MGGGDRMASVSLKNVSKVYDGDVVAVKDFSMDIHDGEFVVLVGPSGCGKSTTLRMVAGLEEVSGGEIRIGDRVVNEVEPKDRDIAMVFQNYALYPHMTVYKNMAFGLKLRKVPRKEIDAKVRETARILGIEELLQRKPKALSGGQRQRVAVGRAIVRDPKVFLFDEPLSNLDAMMRVQMRGEIEKLHARLGTTMIYVTHDQVEAMTMGDRIVVMLDGEVQQIATPMELYKKPKNKFVAGFIGTPPMNFLSGALHAESGALRFVAGDGKVNLEVDPRHSVGLGRYQGQRVTLGLRPEVFVENQAQRVNEGKSVEAVVTLVEPLGAETYLYLDTAGQPLTARVSGEVQPRVQAPHIIDVDMSRAYYFDPINEAAIV